LRTTTTQDFIPCGTGKGFKKHGFQSCFHIHELPIIVILVLVGSINHFHVVIDCVIMEPWEGLDVEQQDLESFIKRCKSATTLILGPVGNVQAAMINQDKEHAQSTQQFAWDIAFAPYERDFK